MNFIGRAVFAVWSECIVTYLTDVTQVVDIYIASSVSLVLKHGSKQMGTDTHTCTRTCTDTYSQDKFQGIHWVKR